MPATVFVISGTLVLSIALGIFIGLAVFKKFFH